MNLFYHFIISYIVFQEILVRYSVEYPASFWQYEIFGYKSAALLKLSPSLGALTLHKEAMCVLQTSMPMRNNGTPLGRWRGYTSLLFKIVCLFFTHTHMSTHGSHLGEYTPKCSTISYLRMLVFMWYFFNFFIFFNISLINVHLIY